MRYKLLLYTFLFVGLFCSYESYAQGLNDDVFTTTKSNAHFYPVPKDQFFGSNHREALDYKTNGRPKTVSLPQNVQIVGLVNLDPSLGYDTYIVMLKGKRYYVHNDDVEDNYYLEKENSKLQKEYQLLSNAVQNNEALWNNVIYNKEAFKMDLTSMKIEYTDGTSLIMD